MNKRIYLSSPHLGGTEIDFINEAISTNWVAPLGPNVDGFEKDLEKYLGDNVHIAALSSGTAAIHLALVLLNVGPGDEVICQSMTFSASANPIVYQGAMPVFIDSEPDTWNLSPEVLDEAIRDRISKGKKPKAVIAVHLYGMPFKVAAVREVCKTHGIPLVEDSAEALGSSYRDHKCGTFGDLSILSFNGNKIITTSGGGALVCQSRTQKDKVVFLSTQARDDAPHYQHSEIGYNYRMSNICAGIGRGQMEVLDEHVRLRREMNSFYRDVFAAKVGVRVFVEPGPDFFSNHWLTCIQVDRELAGFTTEDLRLALEKEQIESRPLWKPMHLQPVFRDAPYYGGNTAENLFENGLCLPSGSNLNDADMQRIMAVLSKFN